MTQVRVQQPAVRKSGGTTWDDAGSYKKGGREYDQFSITDSELAAFWVAPDHQRALHVAFADDDESLEGIFAGIPMPR